MADQYFYIMYSISLWVGTEIDSEAQLAAAAAAAATGWTNVYKYENILRILLMLQLSQVAFWSTKTV